MARKAEMTGISAKKRMFSIAAVRESTTACINASASGDGAPLLLTVIASSRRCLSARLIASVTGLGLTGRRSVRNRTPEGSVILTA